MARTLADIFRRVAWVLQDPNYTRWPLQELLEWVNDGMQDMVHIKPSVHTETVVLDLVEGTLQTLTAEQIQLVRVNRNMEVPDSFGSTVQTGNAIVAISRQTIDGMIPGWQDNRVLPYSKYVTNVIHDINDQSKFHVVPGNDGTGRIEVVLSTLPARIPVPASDPDIIQSYFSVVPPVSAIYLTSLVDYVLFRAYSKDASLANAGARAQSHYARFQSMLGLKVQAETLANVYTTEQQQS